METQINKLLASDHAELDAMLDRLFAAFETGDAERIYQRLDLFWARLAMHIRAEHLHLFPALVQAFAANPAEEKSGLSPESVESRIAQLKGDHDFFMRELAGAIKQMRETRAGEDSAKISAVREKISGVVERLKTHNETEETEVYRWADRIFSPAERAGLNERMQKELDNLPPRFDRSN